MQTATTLQAIATLGLIAACADRLPTGDDPIEGFHVEVTPATAELQPGGTLQLSATTTDGNGSPVSGQSITWLSSDTSIATVSPSGLVSARATGSATITATSNEVQDSASIRVLASSSGSAQPWFEENFSRYTSTEDLLINYNVPIANGSFQRDPNGVNWWKGDYGWIYNGKDCRWPELLTNNPNYCGDDYFPARIKLDSTVVLPGVSRSMRYDQLSSGECEKDYTVGRNIMFPHVTPKTEMWVEVYVRFSPTFKTDWRAECGNIGNPDQKLIFFALDKPAQNDHVFLLMGNGGRHWVPGLETGTPTFWEWEPNIDHGPLPNAEVNERWLQLRFYMRSASATGVNDGVFRFWVDGVLKAETTTSALYNPHGFSGLALARNINIRPLQDQSIWWGQIRVWTSGPGW